MPDSYSDLKVLSVIRKISYRNSETDVTVSLLQWAIDDLILCSFKLSLMHNG